MANEPMRCELLHGHDFTVTAEAAHDLLDAGVPRGCRGLEGALSGVCFELDSRPFDQMAPGAQETLTGIAAYIYERLAHRFAGLVTVTVSDGRYEGIIRSDA